MSIHTIKTEQTVQASPEECWDFFSNPANLERITPPDLDFRILSELPGNIHPGMMIEYRVRPLLGIPMTWLTEITNAREPHYFCDEQRVGPYAMWHHEHTFRQREDGGTDMTDLVHYVLPLSPFSEIAHGLLVKPQLRKIFDFRTEAVDRIFASG